MAESLNIHVVFQQNSIDKREILFHKGGEILKASFDKKSDGKCTSIYDPIRSTARLGLYRSGHKNSKRLAIGQPKRGIYFILELKNHVIFEAFPPQKKE